MADEDITIDQQFSTPICKAMLTGFDAHQQGLVDCVNDLRENTSGIQSSNYKGWHSHRFLHRDPKNEHLSWLVSKLTITIVKTLTRLGGDQKGVDIRFRELWANINSKGEWNMPHIHPVHWAGVVYITAAPAETEEEETANKQPYKPGDTLFQNPVEQATYFGQKSNAPYTAEPGAMLLFPGYLRHMVVPHEDDEDRITFAFNVDRVSKPRRPVKTIPEEDQQPTVNLVI